MSITPVILTMCLNFQGSGNSACNTLLDQISNETKTTATLNLLESETRKEVERDVSHEILYSLTALATIADMANKKQIIFQIPLGRRFEFSSQLTLISDNYTLKYTVEF